MKKQIITLVVGILIGAVVTAAAFLIFKPSNSRNIPDFSQFNKEGFDPTKEGFDPTKEGFGRGKRDKDGTNDDSLKVNNDKQTGDTANENKK